MIAVYKYPLRVTARQAVGMPLGAEILSVQTQDGRGPAGRSALCLWALVNTKNPEVGRDICIAGTGQEIELLAVNAKTHLATVQDGSLVWHVFDLGELT